MLIAVKAETLHYNTTRIKGSTLKKTSVPVSSLSFTLSMLYCSEMSQQAGTVAKNSAPGHESRPKNANFDPL